jgi:SAM-dependent methyltransferase
VSSILTKIAKAALKAFPARPSAEYLPMDEVTPEHAARRAKGELEDEESGGLMKFFDAAPDLPEGAILDLGCGYGGRTIAFQRRFGHRAYGIDVDPRMVGPARRFARSLGVEDADFVAAVGEDLPFADESIATILSYDVLEHVEDPEQCLAECARVLKPGGLFLLVFPPYHHPTGAHLEGYVSHLPYANVLFSQRVLLSAVDEILDERGDGFRPRPLRPTDKLYCLNGLTIRGFRDALSRSGFEVASLRLLPLFSELNRKYDAWKMRYYAWAFSLLTHVPVARECFTHRVVAVLRKPATGIGARNRPVVAPDRARTGVTAAIV